MAPNSPGQPCILPCQIFILDLIYYPKHAPNFARFFPLSFSHFSFLFLVERTKPWLNLIHYVRRTCGKISFWEQGKLETREFPQELQWRQPGRNLHNLAWEQILQNLSEDFGGMTGAAESENSNGARDHRRRGQPWCRSICRASGLGSFGYRFAAWYVVVTAGSLKKDVGGMYVRIAEQIAPEITVIQSLYNV